MNMYGESPHSIPSKLYQVPQANRGITERPVVGPHILSTDAISDTQIMLRWTVSLARFHSDLGLGEMLRAFSMLRLLTQPLHGATALPLWQRWSPRFDSVKQFIVLKTVCRWTLIVPHILTSDGSIIVSASNSAITALLPVLHIC